MQSSHQESQEGIQRKSLSRATIAAALALSLIVWASGTGIAGDLWSEAAPPSAKGDLSDLLGDSAITFVERSRPWVEALVAAPEAEQRKGLAELLEVLHAEDPERSTRTAVLLGTLLAHNTLSASTRSAVQEALTIKLAQRMDMGARWKVSADIVAARALDVGYGSREERAAVRNGLLELAHGAEPHPHLAVRVECAATALKLAPAQPAPKAELDAVPARGAATETAAFLLAVLRAETPGQVKSPRSWPRMTTLAWVKTAAAEALAHWTATDNRFRPDGSWAHQVAEAARFESLLR